MRKLNIAINFYRISLCLLVVVALIFMTPYYDLFVFGNQDTTKVYELFQTFNHNILYAAIILMVFAFIAKALDFGTEIFGLPAVICSWVLTIVSFLLLVPQMIYLYNIIPNYLQLDFTSMSIEYTGKLSMIYLSLAVIAFILLVGLCISIYSSKFYYSRKGGGENE